MNLSVFIKRRSIYIILIGLCLFSSVYVSMQMEDQHEQENIMDSAPETQPWNRSPDSQGVVNKTGPSRINLNETSVKPVKPFIKKDDPKEDGYQAEEVPSLTDTQTAIKRGFLENTRAGSFEHLGLP